MMHNIALAGTLLAALSFTPAGAASVGFRQTVTGTDSSRPINVTLWYPTEADGPRSIVGENSAFVGTEVVKDAPIADGKHPLVLLSHGYRGNWRNLNWLAAELVHAGYAVAAPDHPATTSFDWRPEDARKLWLRPKDISRVIDDIYARPDLLGPIDPDRIAAIGHSLGGWTVLELAGGRYDPKRTAADCDPAAGAVHCKTLAELGIDGNGPIDPEMLSDRHDPRIRAFVSLDLGPARGFTPESLASIKAPMLVFSAGSNLPGIDATNTDSHFVAASLNLPKERTVEIADALHFSFMQLCKPGAIALIESDAPGEGMVCKDGGGRDREAIHREVADRILGFLEEVIPPAECKQAKDKGGLSC
jgi:predicted dienelactone hydrolase